jgi:hypothetical protein
MSDQSSNMEIQDVLSSIRRLVSEDKGMLIANATKKPAAASPAAEQQDKLVLTPAHRVQDGADTAADGASLEDTIAELEAAVADTDGEFEPDGSEVAKADPADADPDLERAFEESFAVDVAAEEEEASALSQPVTSGILDEADDAVTAEPEADPDPEAAEDDLLSEDGTSAPETDDDESSTAGTDEEVAAVDMPSPEKLDELIVASTAAAAGAYAARRLNLSAAELVHDRGAPWGRTDAPEREDAPDDDAAAQGAEPAEATTSTADMEAEADAQILREIVADIVRQELQGPLGERITRSVRMLVRREINRALESRDFE